jgi:hypothetical protein
MSNLKMVDFWTRQMVEHDSTSVYLFGDNVADAIPGKDGKYFVPRSTQAVIRGLKNAIGIPTKKTRGTGEDAYFRDTDQDFKLFKIGVDKAIEKAKLAAQSGKTVKMSSAGIGSGAAAEDGVFAVDGGGRFFDYLYKRIGELANAK